MNVEREERGRERPIRENIIILMIRTRIERFYKNLK